jgi:hypothetical protein
MFVQGKFKFFLIDGLIGNPKKVCCGSHVSLDNFGREIIVMLGMNILIHKITTTEDAARCTDGTRNHMPGESSLT